MLISGHPAGKRGNIVKKFKTYQGPKTLTSLDLVQLYLAVKNMRNGELIEKAFQSLISHLAKSTEFTYRS